VSEKQSWNIEKAAVLGSGVMGMAIAAHLAGCGIDCLVLDIVPFDNMLSEKEQKQRDAGDKRVRNKLAAAALKQAMKWKPPASAFYSKNDAKRITIGNFDDDLHKIKDVDWVIEVVVERMDIKKSLLAKVDEYRGENTIITTNTSGLSVVEMVSDCSPEMRKNFLGTHFFNPVRFMKLLEIIPHPETAPALVSFMESFCSNELGKGVILAKDTPNFIANRIGMHGISLTFQLMTEMDYRIDEVDAICGKAIGHASSAAFKTADLVGIDTMKHVGMTVYDKCPNDEEREIFKPPAFIDQMIENGWLGRKAKSGFYKRGPKKERLVLDWKTMEYIPQEKPEWPSLAKSKEIRKPGARLANMINSDDRGGKFAWKLTAASLLYIARRIPEIADHILDIDNGLCWGFNWEIGPFAGWDAIGLRTSVERMKADGYEIPANITTMLEKGNESFYKEEDGVRYQYDLVNQEYVAIKPDEKIIVLKELGDDRKVASNDGATLWDLGDRVLCYQMHTKMNAIDNETIEMQNKAVDLLEADEFDAMVIANNSKNFSVGANLMLVLMGLHSDEENKYDQIEEMVKALQDVNMRMKYCSKPIVAAPVGFTFGGGCEIALHAHRVVGAAETYAGLVEVGVGLIPAGGGTKELVMRALEGVDMSNRPSLLPFLQKAFENIAKAEVATGLKAAMDLGIFRQTDVMVTNAEYRIYEAKKVALGMFLTGHNPGKPRTDIPVGGVSATAAFMIAVDGMVKSGWASEHDRLIADKVAWIIGGGDRAEGQTISEQELLDMERKVFMDLLREEKTVERIQYMLMNNKPLRN
tara:strand:+ start:6224 stop:8653 length:2430 start_codon:yes stop_codon:yes gene_type:complete